MQQNNNDIQKITEDEISLKELILIINNWCRFLLSKWVVLLVAGIIGGTIGVGYATNQKPIYSAELSFVIEDEQSGGGGLSGAMGLASSLGIDIGSSAGGAFTGANLFELMKSRKIVEKALLNPVTVNGKTQSFAQYFIGSNVKNTKAFDHDFLDVDADRSKYTRQQDSILGDLYKSVKAMVSVSQKDKKVSIITLEIKNKDEFFCKAFVENLSNVVSSYYIEIKSKKARQNMEILQRQTDSIRAVLNGNIVSVASAVDNTFGLNPAMQLKKSIISKKQFDVQANTAILTQLVTSLEMAKVTLRKETPLIQVIDSPILPLEKTKVGKFKSLVFGLTISIVSAMIYLIIRRIYYEMFING